MLKNVKMLSIKHFQEKQHFLKLYKKAIFDKIEIFHKKLIMVMSLKWLFCFKSISILSLMSFFWNTMHQMLELGLQRATSEMLHFKMVGICLGITVLYGDNRKAFLCSFDAIYASLNIKSMGLVGVECRLYIIYILLYLSMMGECLAVFAFWKIIMLFVKSASHFFYFKTIFFAVKLT